MKGWSSMNDAEKIGLVAGILVVLGDILAVVALFVDTEEVEETEESGNTGS